MKRIILFFALALCLVCALASCNTEHTHSYVSTVVAPGCETQGYTEYKCECGDSYKDSYTDPAGHSLGGWITVAEASYEKMGYKKNSCKGCDYYEEDNIPMLVDPTAKVTVQNLFTTSILDGYKMRIPSLITTKNGVTIAAVDRGHGSGDYGDISVVIRRSTDSGRSWSDYQTLIDPPQGSAEAVEERIQALVIDISMTYDAEIGRVLLLTSFYPESHANWTTSKIDLGTGYKKINGEQMLILRNHSLTDPAKQSTRSYTKELYLGSDGVVYDKNGKATEYTVPSMATGKLWHDGSLYKNGEPAGNIFLYTGENKGEFSIMCMAHLLVMYSDDDGESWSDPISLNAMINKPTNVRYFGIGPGVGIQTSSGRLVVPCWSNSGVSMIYSDDHGVTWQRGENVPRGSMTTNSMNESQVVELTDKNGDKILKLFGRSNGKIYISTSRDGGVTWSGTYSESQVTNPDCQVSAMALPFELEGFENKQLVLVSCSSNSDSTRKNGKIWLGVYDEQTDTFDFSRSIYIRQSPNQFKSYWYSCMTVLPNNEIGILFEISTSKTVFANFRPGALFDTTTGEQK